MNPVSYFHKVVIYAGHREGPVLGPYLENVSKRVEMFTKLKEMRQKEGKPSWEVIQVSGERLPAMLDSLHPRETLLVIPAGQSSHLDQAFSSGEKKHLYHWFAERGGRGYFNCGSAYWVSTVREYDDLCLNQPETRTLIVKHSSLPIFEGRAIGPLCPYPGKKYSVGFFSDAVKISDGERSCSILLSGGGSFVPPPRPERRARVSLLAHYVDEELLRLGIHPGERGRWRNAAIMTEIGKGAALLSMFHPYYSARDLDRGRYAEQFPDSGSDWEEIVKKLSSEEERMQFAMRALIDRLEGEEF